MRSPEDVGSRAFRNGRDRSSNPFKRGTPEYKEWVVGWRRAQSAFYSELLQNRKEQG